MSGGRDRSERLHDRVARHGRCGPAVDHARGNDRVRVLPRLAEQLDHPDVEVDRRRNLLDRVRRRPHRELLDLFEVAEDPASGKAAIIYTDTTLDTWTSPVTGLHQLPEIVLAYEQ